MEHRPLGRTGVKVSQLGLGTMMFGGRTSHEESLRIIALALDQGVDLIDAADVYAGNESERIVGEALAGDGRRAKTILATRAGRWTAPPTSPGGVSSRAAVGADRNGLVKRRERRRHKARGHGVPCRPRAQRPVVRGLQGRVQARQSEEGRIQPALRCPRNDL